MVSTDEHGILRINYNNLMVYQTEMIQNQNR